MSHIHEVVFASSDKAESGRVRKLVKIGQLKELAPRVYTSNFTDSPEKIVLRNCYIMLSHLFPDSILSHRSAIEGRPVEGHIFLTYTSSRNVYFPGLTVHLLKGAGKEIGTVHFFENLHRSSESRFFLENM